jgi:hypothetical protein
MFFLSHGGDDATRRVHHRLALTGRDERCCRGRSFVVAQLDCPSRDVDSSSRKLG